MPAVALLLLAVLACIPRDRDSRVTVSGKTVYGTLAVEDVVVEAHPLSADGRGPVTGATRSGYHGSFVLSLPPGRYALSAKGFLPTVEGGRLELSGAVEDLELPPGKRRLDRLVLRLQAVPEGSQ